MVGFVATCDSGEAAIAYRRRGCYRVQAVGTYVRRRRSLDLARRPSVRPSIPSEPTGLCGSCNHTRWGRVAAYPLLHSDPHDSCTAAHRAVCASRLFGESRALVRLHLASCPSYTRQCLLRRLSCLLCSNPVAAASPASGHV